MNPTEAKICLACEWAKCSQIIETYADIQSHVKQHLPAVAREGLFTCEWDLCSFETESQPVFRRHVLYHAYMSNLKSLGEQLLLKKEPLPACINDSRRRNAIPKAEHQLICQWEECTYKFELVQDFFDHARGHCIHELELSKEKNRNNFVQCRWLDCAKKFNKRLKMTDHMRTHTGERFVACSNCGSTFNSYAKFYDHFKRQTLNRRCSGRATDPPRLTNVSSFSHLQVQPLLPVVRDRGAAEQPHVHAHQLRQVHDVRHDVPVADRPRSALPLSPHQGEAVPMHGVRILVKPSLSPGYGRLNARLFTSAAP